MKKILSTLLALAMLLGCASAFAADFPAGDVTLICPFAPGGGTDALARVVADIASQKSGKSFIVVNKTGGSGAVGMGEGAVAKADGYTVTMTTVECVLLPLAGLASFNTKDFAPIIRINFDPAALLVRADSPYQSVDDLVAAAKEKPGEISLMVSAFPTNFWLCGAMLMEKSEAEFNLIPNGEGAADQIQNLLGGHVDAIVITPAEGASYVESGDFRLLAIASESRNEVFPEVPTFQEQNYDIVVGTWRGLMVPKDTPADVVSALNDLFTQAYNDPAMGEFLAKMGFGEGYLNSEDFSKLIDAQIEQYGPVIAAFK